MAEDSIIQGAVTDVIIDPTWGTREGDNEKEGGIDISFVLQALESHYYKKPDIDTMLDSKADAIHTHNDIYYLRTDIDTLLNAKADVTDLGDMALEDDAPSDDKQYGRKNGAWEEIQSTGGGSWGTITGILSDQTDLQNALDNKADAIHNHDDRYYTETEVDTLLNGKADAIHNHDDRYYTETEVDTLLNGKADTIHNHDDRYYTETETDALLNGKADAIHNHDDRYYTETETDALLNDKANTADLGSMATKDDAPSNDSEYVRKNGDWAVASTAASRYTQTVILKDVYTSASKMYTLESNGLLGVRLSGSKTGAARVCDSQTNDLYLQLGLASGGYITWLPKGMRVYIYGSVDAAYFMPLN